MTAIAEWMVEGKPDPFCGRYECELNVLTLGHMSHKDLIDSFYAAPSYMIIAYQTAFKERLRWLGYQVYKLDLNKEHLDALSFKRQSMAYGEFTDYALANHFFCLPSASSELGQVQVAISMRILWLADFLEKYNGN